MNYPGIVSPILNVETKLYRYINLKQFLSIVENHKIYLTRINKWEDTWEIPGGKLPSQRDNGDLSYPNWSIDEKMYGNCWSLSEESDALWRIYSPNSDGLKIQTSVKKFSLFNDVYHGLLAPIIYYDNLLEALNELEAKKEYPKPFSRAFLKRNAFTHEQEVRLVTIDDGRCMKSRGNKKDFINLDINPFEFIESVTIDPRADSWYVNTIKKYCNRAEFNFIPTKSNLYNPDIFEQTKIVVKFRPVES